ncbi:Protein FAR1-RELATED SEQUENCE 5 [Quillaja saponaria]|uniref:Protein FAR1-RELATED SEQUENCE 5 n=1 Tax=Quillaja saponaria TaxID=32244 RepID=A0AAD7PDA4_QUISA|nr:Protein FAR1-RELATED SEQUENCE 5 [Quillaja saponaria]
MQRRRSGIDGRTLARRLGCNKQGFSPNHKGTFGPDKKPRPSAREGCNVTILVKMEKSGKWVVSRFVKDHNHPLIVTASGFSTAVSFLDGLNNSYIIHLCFLLTNDQIFHNYFPEDKDKKIEELTMELEHQEQLCAACRENVFSFMNNVEEQTEDLSGKIQAIVDNLTLACFPYTIISDFFEEKEDEKQKGSDLGRMGSCANLDLLTEVAAQKLKEGGTETERKDKQVLKFIPFDEESLFPNSLSLSQFQSNPSEREEKDYLDTETVLLEFIRFCASKKTQNENLSSLKAKRTAGFTLPVGLIPRKKRTLKKRSEIDGLSVSGFEEFHFRGLNKSRKRCFPIQKKYKEGEITIACPMKKKHRKVIDLESQPELPVEFKKKIEELGGSEIKLVIQKELFGTDLNPNNGRFSIPQTQILAEFLTESEMAFLDQRQRNNQGRLCGLDVLVLDPSLCGIQSALEEVEDGDN